LQSFLHSFPPPGMQLPLMLSFLHSFPLRACNCLYCSLSYTHFFPGNRDESTVQQPFMHSFPPPGMQLPLLQPFMHSFPLRACNCLYCSLSYTHFFPGNRDE
jgi:hypothetical protein